MASIWMIFKISKSRLVEIIWAVSIDSEVCRLSSGNVSMLRLLGEGRRWVGKENQERELLSENKNFQESALSWKPRGKMYLKKRMVIN